MSDCRKSLFLIDRLVGAKDLRSLDIETKTVQTMREGIMIQQLWTSLKFQFPGHSQQALSRRQWKVRPKREKEL